LVEWKVARELLVGLEVAMLGLSLSMGTKGPPLALINP